MPKEKEIVLKMPPHNEEAEKSTIGGILLFEDALLKIQDLKPEHFYIRNHQIILESLLELNKENIKIDLVSLSEELQMTGKLEAIGGTVYLMDLMEATPTSTTVKHWAEIVHEKYKLRQVIALTSNANQIAYEGGTKADDIVERIEGAFLNFNRKTNSAGFVRVGDALPATIEKIEQMTSDDKDNTTDSVVMTGFKDFDRLTCGLNEADYLIIAARPSTGKTSLLLNILDNISTGKMHEENGVTVRGPRGPMSAFFSVESIVEQIVMRILCARARVDSNRLRSGFINESEWVRLTMAAGELMESQIFIDHTPGLTISQMRMKLKQLEKKEGKIGAISVDHVGLMGGEKGRRFESEQEKISQISLGLKSIASELKSPMIALSQLSRKVEERKPPEPILSDLRSSGTLEQDSDIVAFLYRPEMYLKGTVADQGPGIAKLLIKKNRNGPIGTVMLTFMKKHTLFADSCGEDGFSGQF